MHRASVLLLTSLLLLGSPSTGLAGDEAPRWSLEQGAMADYTHFVVTTDVKTGERKRGKETAHPVFGHGLRDAAGPTPLFPTFGQLPRILAMRLPPKARGGKDAVVFSHLADCGPLSASGKWTVEENDDGTLALRAEWKLRHRGPVKSRDFTRRLVDGSAVVNSVFDPARGLVTSSSYDFTARLVPDDAKPRDRKITNVVKSGDLDLKTVRRGRDEEFQASVDAAIDRGVAWLKDGARKLKKAKKNKDGTKGKKPEDGYPKYGKYAGGIEGLVALTLYATDPMREAGDDALKIAMAEKPKWVYQTAVTMLAIEMKRTPPGEAAMLRSGKIDKPKRNLSDDERAWMTAATKFLLERAAGPGKWTYPSKPAGGRFLPPKPDLSNGQYAVLGLLAAHRCEIPMDDNDWLGIVRAFLQVQESKGPRMEVDFPRHGA
ncbi:MAG: hypothetical protein ACYTG4_10150, partial [Planctomycetota bacterium]